jgi:undecaprenyl-diphosphatase
VGIALALRPRPRELTGALLASLPAAGVGYLAHDLVEDRLGKPGPTAALLAAAGIALVVADRAPETRAASARDVSVAAVAQAAALVPGVSRSGATIIALRRRGVRREDALRTSLVMSLPITVGAAALTTVRSGRTPPLVPSGLAAVTAYVAARRVRGSLRLTSGSAAYRLALATAVALRLRKESSR